MSFIGLSNRWPGNVHCLRSHYRAQEARDCAEYM